MHGDDTELDCEVGEDAAWECLPADAIKNDVRTEGQKSVDMGRAWAAYGSAWDSPEAKARRSRRRCKQLTAYFAAREKKRREKQQQRRRYHWYWYHYYTEDRTPYYIVK